MDRGSWPSTTGESSRPLALDASSVPRSPYSLSNWAGGRAAKSPMVRISRSCSRARDFGPTPHSISTGSGARKLAPWPGGTTTSPFGFPTSVATLATSLFPAAPQEVGSPNCSRIRVCSSLAMSPDGRGSSLTSRKASSMEICSTSGADPRRRVMTLSEYSPYSRWLPRTGMRSGHSRRARAIGMAERTPKARAA